MKVNCEECLALVLYDSDDIICEENVYTCSGFAGHWILETREYIICPECKEEIELHISKEYYT